MNRILISTILLFSLKSYSQTNVRAWYADGQVFVVWTIDLPVEESYAIYTSPDPFIHTSDATLIGRPIFLEYLGYGLKENLSDTSATYRIPDGSGGKYQLNLNEALFVFTPHQNGSRYFAVTKWGSDAVIPGQNITDSSVPFTFDPMNDPVECHLQRIFPSPFTSGYLCFAYSIWSDGRQNHWEGRPDFPIMANEAKNGMPSLFLVSAPVNLDTTNAYTLSVWLHGGGGIARQSLAGSRPELNINPEQGILVAHEDKLHGYRGTIPPHPDQSSWHFGYSKNYDPFSENTITPLDTVINYIQRRYLWIDHWLTKNFNIDTNRINIHGHSMGSAGTIALVKSFPNHYGSATIFNTGCAGPDDPSSTTFIFGTKADNMPTNLKNRNNDVVRFYDLWDLYTNCSHERDFPLIKHWHGKNDDIAAMQWSPVVVENFRICDSIGTGIQNHWSERPHGPDLAPLFNDHWIQGIPSNQQTHNDDVRFAESEHRSNESFPAFMNHRLDPKNNDPGTGLFGINNGDGDNWGTWGGYHRWANMSETSHTWGATAWLESNAVFSNDNSPEDFLTADVAIRRPQLFKPTAGQTLAWIVVDVFSGDTLQHGMTIVNNDGVVVIPRVNIYKESNRRSRIAVTDVITSIDNDFADAANFHISPNPSNGIINVHTDWRVINIFDLNGLKILNRSFHSPSSYLDVSALSGGIYFIEVIMKDGARKTQRFVKM